MLKTITLHEYGEFVSLASIANTLEMSKESLWSLILKGLKKLSNAYPKQGFLETKSLDSFRFAGIAGILALSPTLHIEIVPKFLSVDDNQWKDDFLFLALLTNDGHLFEKYLHRASGKSNNLYEIIAKIWVDNFEKNQRRIIKTYVKNKWTDFSLDGDFEEEDIIIPSSEGYLQKGLKLSKANNYNKILLEACEILLVRIKKAGIYERLSRAKISLQNDLKGYIKTKKTPNLSRNNNWTELLILAKLLIDNRSISYHGGNISLMPGFIIRTDKLWERFLRKAAQKSFPEITIAKNSYCVGYRHYKNGKISKINATPDISFHFGEGIILADAKYKSINEQNNTRSGNAIISSSDLYESLAFMQATNTNNLLLIYPNTLKVQDDSIQYLENITSNNRTICAVSLGVTGISSKNGFKKVVENIKKVITTQQLNVS